MKTSVKKQIERSRSGDNMWLRFPGSQGRTICTHHRFRYILLETEEAVGRAMFEELLSFSKEKAGDINIVLLGGRGAQAMYRLINLLAEKGEIDDLLSRLNVFTQDALAPLRMDNGLSFVRDFERLLGEAFFKRIKSFTPMQTDTSDLETSLVEYLEKLYSLGGIDIFYLGFGPEAEAASHLCYIKPFSGAGFDDLAGVIPISESILEHHISKFKAGGSKISTEDAAECRAATKILTLGPAAILGAKRIVQSIVDASTAPAKITSFKRLIETKLSEDADELQRQTDENPGLLIRLHQDVRSYILPDLIA